MPKTVSNLFDQVIDYSNLVQAYHAAIKGKSNRYEPLKYSQNWEENLLILQEKLKNQTWRPGTARKFTVTDPKTREICAPPFEDRIVHHAMVRVVEPYFEKKFINHSYACRKHKGTQAAAKKVQEFLRKAKRNYGDGIYVIHVDIKSCFQSVDHEILMASISSTISDIQLLQLWETCLTAYGYQKTGMPVGALTSQIGANIILNNIDHYIKDNLGVKYYVRYMDDFVIICENKKQARHVFKLICNKIVDLKFKPNPKSKMTPWRHGVDFCGYRIWPTHLLVRKRNIKKFKRDLKIIKRLLLRNLITISILAERINSLHAYCKHANSTKTTQALADDIHCFLIEHNLYKKQPKNTP